MLKEMSNDYLHGKNLLIFKGIDLFPTVLLVEGDILCT